MTPINSSRDLAQARSIPHAVIFFWVNWSISAVQSRVVVEQAKSLDRTLPVPVPYFVVDVSDQHGEVWDALREWLQADDTATEHVVWAGSGALLWIRAGKVVYQMIDPMMHARADIAAISKKAFSSV
jgi:hypothetical protein